MNSFSLSIDKAAVGLSMVCVAHCLLLPVALAVLPVLAATTFGDEQFHRWMLLLVLPTSLVALSWGCRRHKRIAVVATGITGLAILTLAVCFGHEWLGETGEKFASILGASVIALAHIRNHSLCKRLQCSCEGAEASRKEAATH